MVAPTSIENKRFLLNELTITMVVMNRFGFNSKLRNITEMDVETFVAESMAHTSLFLSSLRVDPTDQLKEKPCVV